MHTHHVEATLAEDGALTLSNLPFKAGEAVEVIIVGRSSSAPLSDRDSLRGSVLRYGNPTEPVAEEDWEPIR